MKQKKLFALMVGIDEYEGAVSSQGLFTGTLLEVLEKQGPAISYADVFIRCRDAIRKLSCHQTPQFECYGGFNAYTAFLEGSAIARSPRCTVFYEDNTGNIKKTS